MQPWERNTRCLEVELSQNVGLLNPSSHLFSWPAIFEGMAHSLLPG